MPYQAKNLIAAIDMGSSSFRMIVARVDTTHEQPQIFVIDSLREPVRLGAGLDDKKKLDQDSQDRALACLSRFSERLRPFKPEQVRAVATNAVRVARNGADFIKKAELALGFDIDVISGAEEARLVYCGVAHQLPIGDGQRLVVDIGGGSTEFIIGEDYDPIAMESLYVGCVSFGEQYFKDGAVSAKAFKNAVLAARREIVILRRQLVELGWTHVVGSSGTSRALAEICEANGWSDHGITKNGLDHLRDELIKAKKISDLKLAGIKEDRRQNIPGGLAVMMAVFEELGLSDM
ncbi:MAG: Ppx/GppA family phosphatase [Limnobacter sp.]|nr:Ppx/GppA family phosphatase [Limnobacter sp.]